MPVQPVLLIHGGANVRSAFADVAAVGASLDRIVLEAADLLARGASALDAAACAVEGLEADPLFNAGYGAKLQRDGIARLSASAMDGSSGRFGAVINVQDLCHPSRLALHLLEAEDRVLDATGADRLASELRMPRNSPLTERRVLEWKNAVAVEPHGTVGAVALDRAGRLAALTSTGGRGNERVGRVSDSATPAGNYADLHAAISCTGIGEDIVESAAAPRLAAWVEMGLSLEAAAGRLMARLERDRRQLGFIAVDARGHLQARTSTPCLAYRAWKKTMVDGWPGPFGPV